MPSRAPGKVRIIAGRLRGRRLEVEDLPTLRPTGERIRETVFNWLTPVIDGARCLDLFAGSGALGFEAYSRGAGEVVLVERERRLVETLRRAKTALGAETVAVVHADARVWLAAGAQRGFDVVFLDPPFDGADAVSWLQPLESGGWLSEDARVYLEGPRGSTSLPAHWSAIREKTAGTVRYRLVTRDAGAPG